MKKQESGLGLRAVARPICAKLGTMGASISIFALGGAPHAALAQEAQTAPTAQAAPQSAAAATGEGELQEIVVTATRRTENIQTVPISVQAFTKAQMDAQGIQNIDDIAEFSPSIQFSRGNGGFGSSLGNTISIRGMGTNAGPATTGIYIDDTPVQVGATIASGSFTNDAFPNLFDIQRVEVLNGPQGTLFGSGSEGGAIRFIMTPPDMTTPSLYVRTQAADTTFGAPSYEAGVAGGAPIVDDVLGFRASVYSIHTGGYIDHVNYYTGADENQNNNYTDAVSGRFALGWQPADGLMITPSVYFQMQRANGANSFYLRSDGVTGEFTPFVGPSFMLPVVPQPYGNVAQGDYVNLAQLNQPAEQHMTLPALKVDWTLPRDMEFISDTSFYDRQQSGITDFGVLESGTWGGSVFPENPNDQFPGADSQGDEFFVQQLRLQSTNANSRLHWVAGAFFSHDVTTDSRNVYDPYLPTLLAEGPYGCGSFCYAAIFGDPQFPGGVPLADGIYSFENTTNLTEKQKAVFGQADLQIVGGLTATVGLRYAKFNTNWVNWEGGPINGTLWPGPGGVPESGTAVASVVTPKYMLSYKTDHTLTYASATKGFRNGGVNAALDNPACGTALGQLGLKSAPPTFNPDSVWSYELGEKFTTLNDRLVIDAAVYQYDWSNMIYDQALSTCTLSFTTNLGKSQGRGFELQVQYRPIDPLVLSLNAGYNYLKATQTLSAGNGQIEVDNGDPVPGTGSVVITGSAQYNLVLAERPSYFRVDYLYNGPPAFSNNPLDSSYVNPLFAFRVPGYSQANVRLGMIFGSWDISLFSNNLLNSQPLFKSREGATFYDIPTSIVTATTITPRTSGVTAIYNF